MMPVADRAEMAIAWIVDALQQRGDVARVILFGSRARRDHRPRSDIDLAVDAPRVSARQWQEITEIVDAAETLLPIDLVRLDAAPPELRERIAAEGRILFER